MYHRWRILVRVGRVLLYEAGRLRKLLEVLQKGPVVVKGVPENGSGGGLD